MILEVRISISSPKLLRGRSFIMSYRLGVGGVSQSMTHYDREGGGGKTNYDV